METGRIENKIYRDKTIKKYEKKCLLLGTKKKTSVYTFLNTWVLSSFVLFLLFLFLDYKNLLSILIILGIYIYLFPKVYLDYRIKKRKIQIEEEAIAFFEILLLSLESGSNLFDALTLTTKNCEGELSSEFAKVLEEVSYGKGLEESLHEMKERIPSTAVTNMILNLCQANSYGNSITNRLRKEINYIREIRVLEVKEKINKMPIRVSVVSVLLFIPLLLLLVLGPVIIEFLAS